MDQQGVQQGLTCGALPVKLQFAGAKQRSRVAWQGMVPHVPVSNLTLGLQTWVHRVGSRDIDCSMHMLEDIGCYCGHRIPTEHDPVADPHQPPVQVMNSMTFSPGEKEMLMFMSWQLHA